MATARPQLTCSHLQVEDLKLEKSGHLIDVAECDVRIGVEAYEFNERQREDGKTGVWWRGKVKGKGERSGRRRQTYPVVGLAEWPCHNSLAQV